MVTLLSFRLVCMLLLVLNISTAQVADSSICDTTVKKLQSFRGFIASSFFVNRNWDDLKNSYFVFAGSIDICRQKKTKFKKRINELKSDLSYLGYIDSCWIKSTDDIYLNSIWFFRNGPISKTFNMNFKSQLTNSWDYTESEGQIKQTWNSGPLLPASILLSYGISITFFDDSYVLFSPVTVNVNSAVRTKIPETEKKYIAQTNKIILYSDYGIDIKSSIEKRIGKYLVWENNTYFFKSGTEKESASLDMQNIISACPFKFIKIRFENKIVYDWLESCKLKLQYELLIGYNVD